MSRFKLCTHIGDCHFMPVDGPLLSFDRRSQSLGFGREPVPPPSDIIQLRLPVIVELIDSVLDHSASHQPADPGTSHEGAEQI
ncbi:MAG: hypothetical protein IH913_08745 [Proteobacteria bacterium]|nr:hypothetical protein [Pseudomonadota bacterium]